MQMKDFVSASVSVFILGFNEEDDTTALLFKDEPFYKKASIESVDGEEVFSKSTYMEYTEDEWDILDVGNVSEVITALCDLYPDAYVGNTSQQEIIVSNFVSLTRGLSLYFPDWLIDDFDSRAEEELEDTGETLDIEEEITINGTIFTKFYKTSYFDGEESEDILAIMLSVVVEFEDHELIVNFTFNRSLSLDSNNKLQTVTKPIATDNKKLSYEYLYSLLLTQFETLELNEESTTYVSVFNKNDYAPYNFIYAMNGLFVSAIVDTPSVYRSLKPMNYFVISDVLVGMEGDIIVTDNHSLAEFIEENKLDVDFNLLEEIKDFGDGLLRVLVTFDKFDTLSDELQFVNTHLAEYSNKILDKYMGLTISNPSVRTLREYVQDHYINLCKLVGNPNNLKDRQFIDLEEAPIVQTSHMLIRDITEIPLWVYLVAIPYVLYICNELDDDSLIELVEYEVSGIENHPKFMETVYMVKELLDKPWN